MSKGLFIIKPVEPQPHVDAGEPVEGSIDGEAGLERVLTAKHLVLLGIGAIIGAGIFVISGTAAANHAGPAIMISFVLAGLACAFAGLCYAEFAAMIPVSGSAYSYTYATLGEAVAWFVGWCLVLEYLFAASAVAVGWSGYASGLLASFGVQLPDIIAAAPLAYSDGEIVRTGGLINLPAVLITLAVGWLCYVGIRQSASVNAVVVAIKVVVILMFIGFGLQHVDPANWQPLIPPNEGGDRFGVAGVLRGASIVFFAYIGFDAVSTAAQEAKNPQRDMPIGIIGSLVICTILYIIVSAVMTGMIPYSQLNTAEPVATALGPYPDLLWLKRIVQIGAVAGLSSVILVLMMGLPRILFAMARDGLLFKSLGDVHPRFRTPHKATIVVGLLASIIAALFPLGILGDLVSMGTLLAFSTVCIGVLVLRYTRPDLVRPFKVPFAPVTCTLGALSCMSLVIFTVVLNPTNLKLIVGWTLFGFCIYFLYGYRHSKLRKQQA